MSIFWGLGHYTKPERGTAVTIGAFDGIHRGHQALISRLRADAARLGLASVAITFDRHPLEVVAPQRAPLLLNTPRERAHKLADLGVSRVIVLPFDESMANMEAADFVSDVLVEQVGARHAVVGHNFMFGRNRSGDSDYLRQLGGEVGLSVEIAEPCYLEGELVSSTAVRNAVAAGDVSRAAAMLGYCYSVRGEVVQGDARGRELGYPTANVCTPERLLLPANGIYAVNARFNGMLIRGAANIGVRPTLGGGPRWLEVHLIGYRGDLYGKNLEVHFLNRLRSEMKFESVEALVAQIDEDVRQALAAADCPPFDSVTPPQSCRDRQ